ncbi:MAG: FAD-binding protein [candidate division KSB1 bacterium]|nr:FAD-binding protein [candidate division KSB1 bacterium]MDZ7368705.1 FAD-binding protein [candidate division KSB1 bacterium]MDZ7406554.1 FAD-binding protein [candidate division KSB1 bacterium]
MLNLSPDFDAALEKIFASVKIDEPLSLHTTLGVGGPAARLATATNVEQIQNGLRLARQFNVPVFILGWGSNLIVSDRGFAGLVIKNRAQNRQILGAPVKLEKTPPKTLARLQPQGEGYYQIDDLMYSEEDSPPVIVQVESGAKIDTLMKALFKQGITGLQWFAGIPATVGGAIYMNMHGGYHFFGDFVHRALLFDAKSCQAKEVDQAYFKFDYDDSILHKTREAVLWAQLRLFRGNVGRAQATAREWARRKALQPQRSAGCVFRNLSAEEQKRLNLPTPSIGYLVEHVLKLKGLRRGDAIVSPRHAAFIENLGQARAQDVKALIDLVAEKARTELGLELHEEVEYLGKF